MLTEGQIQCMKENLTAALAQIIIEERHYTMEQALSIVYNSSTFRNLQNTATGFYYQSPGYLYDDLCRGEHTYRKDAEEDSQPAMAADLES